MNNLFIILCLTKKVIWFTISMYKIILGELTVTEKGHFKLFMAKFS